MATTKERVASVGNKASCHHVRQVAVTYRRGTSVARSLKFLALPLPYLNQQALLTNITVTYSSSRY